MIELHISVATAGQRWIGSCGLIGAIGPDDPAGSSRSIADVYVAPDINRIQCLCSSDSDVGKESMVDGDVTRLVIKGHELHGTIAVEYAWSVLA